MAYDFSRRCMESLDKNLEVVERLLATIVYYREDGFFFSSQINELVRHNNDEEYLHGVEPDPQRALELEVTDFEVQKNGGQEKTE